MMFNISIDGSSYSKNLEDFDSIRSVLLYRSVRTPNYPAVVQTIYFPLYLFILFWCFLVFLAQGNQSFLKKPKLNLNVLRV